MPSTIHTFTGRMVDPLALRAEDVCIEDIAHHLSMQCRFSGAVRYFYSVAQHSALVARYVPVEYALDALMHDAAEAYLQDMARPLKVSHVGDLYREAEDHVERVLAEVFGLAYPHPEIVSEVDVRVLVTEARDLLHGTEAWGYYQDVSPYDEIVQPWYPPLAEEVFLGLFEVLNTAKKEERT